MPNILRLLDTSSVRRVIIRGAQNCAEYFMTKRNGEELES